MKPISIWLNYVVPTLLVIGNLLASTYLFINNVKYDELNNVPRRLWDFYVYYRAGHDVIENSQRLYDTEPIIFGFVNLPIVGYLFTPFSLLNQTAADIVFWILSIICAFVIGYLLIKLTNASGWRRISLIALLALNYPLFYSIRIGNTTQFVFLCLIGLLYCYQTKRYVWAGLLLSISALIKLPLIFLLLYFIMKRSWSIVLASLISLGSTTITSLIVCGIHLNWIWLNKCVLAFGGKAISASNVQSVTAFITRFSTSPPYNQTPVSWLPSSIDYPSKLIIFLAIALLVGLTFLFIRENHLSEVKIQSLDFSIFLTLSILISPLSWSHYYLFLLLPISLLITDYSSLFEQSKYLIFLLSLSILLVSCPPLDSIFSSVIRSLPIPIYNVLVSNMFIGGFLLWIVLIFIRKKVEKYSFSG